MKRRESTLSEVLGNVSWALIGAQIALALVHSIPATHVCGMLAIALSLLRIYLQSRP